VENRCPQQSPPGTANSGVTTEGKWRGRKGPSQVESAFSYWRVSIYTRPKSGSGRSRPAMLRGGGVGGGGFKARAEEGGSAFLRKFSSRYKFRCDIIVLYQRPTLSGGYYLTRRAMVPALQRKTFFFDNKPNMPVALQQDKGP